MASVVCRFCILLGWVQCLLVNGVVAFSYFPCLSYRGCRQSHGRQQDHRCENIASAAFVLSRTYKSLLLFLEQQQRASSSESCISYPVQVVFEGRSCQIQVYQNETILAAMERNGVANQLACSSLPFDCRRGNCLTCAGRILTNPDNDRDAPADDHDDPHYKTHHQSSSSSSSVVIQSENGLTPYMARQVEECGFVLTCSSYITGHHDTSLTLELGQNHRAWQQLWSRRLQDEQIQAVGRAAVARVMRRRAERHLTKWASETEHLLQQQQQETGDNNMPLGDWT